MTILTAWDMKRKRFSIGLYYSVILHANVLYAVQFTFCNSISPFMAQVTRLYWIKIACRLPFVEVDS